MIDVHVKGCFFVTRPAYEHMKTVGYGRIVNTSSGSGLFGSFGQTAYSAAKAAIYGFTRTLAIEGVRYGIHVNAIAPGEIKTSILSPSTEEQLIPEIPMRRLGTPEEVAKTIYFLCSDQSSYVNGAEIHINGGQHA